MGIAKKMFPILILLLIVAVVWVGVSIHFQNIDLDIDPKAESLVSPISDSFDMEVVQKLSEKTEDSFPISPSEFLRLNTVED